MATDPDVKSIDECNAGGISVFFDACVLIPAIRRNDSREREYLLKINSPLRLIASVTLYEVAFAHRGIQPETLRDNQRWIRDRHFTPIWFSPAIGQKFDKLLQRETHRLRGKTTLGDLLLACWARDMLARGTKVAIATANKKDFRDLSVPLVTEFLPGRSEA